MYHKYQTEGFVLDSQPFGESSKIFYIFTSDLGLIRASARSVRRAGLKLKSGLEDYSWGRFTFIKGKNGWKITEALPESNLYFSSKRKSDFIICAKITYLLKKLMPEDEPNADLFFQLRQDLDFLFGNDLSEALLKNLECLVVLRILHNFGYLDKSLWEPSIDRELSVNILEEFSVRRASSIMAINKSLKASQLV